MRHTNPSGYVYYDNEDELCEELENLFFPTFFDGDWKPTMYETKEVYISPYDRIDYFGIKDKKETYVEVKNWWVTNKDIKQILRYEIQIQGYDYYLICGGIEDCRRKILDKFDIKIILTKDIKEINPQELAHWI